MPPAIWHWTGWGLNQKTTTSTKIAFKALTPRGGKTTYSLQIHHLLSHMVCQVLPRSRKDIPLLIKERSYNFQMSLAKSIALPKIKNLIDFHVLNFAGIPFICPIEITNHWKFPQVYHDMNFYFFNWPIWRIIISKRRKYLGKAFCIEFVVLTQVKNIDHKCVCVSNFV